MEYSKESEYYFTELLSELKITQTINDKRNFGNIVFINRYNNKKVMYYNKSRNEIVFVDYMGGWFDMKEKFTFRNVDISNFVKVMLLKHLNFVVKYVSYTSLR
jgi:hypothetical protein